MKRPSLAWLGAAAALMCLVWLAGLLVRAHLPYWLPLPRAMHNYDEGYISAVAVRMLNGRMLPYVDAVDHRTPLLYWLVALIGLVADPLSFWPARIGALIAGLGTLVFTWLSGWLAGRKIIAAVGAIFFVATTVYWLGPYNGMAYNAEIVLDMFAMAALACLTAALSRATIDRRALALVAASGALVMISALAKQVGLVALVPCGLWIACAQRRPQLTSRQRLWLPSLFLAGLVAPLAIVVAIYAAHGEAHTLYYWTIVRVRDVYMAPYTPALRHAAHVEWLRNHAGALITLAALSAWVTVRWLRRARAVGFTRAYDEHGFALTVAAGSIGATLAAHAPLRDWAHYYVQAFPWLGLLVGVVVADGLRLAQRRALDFLAVGLLAAALVAMTVFSAPDYAEPEQSDPSTSAICRFADDWSAPDEPIFIWGFDAEYYIHCQRRPASRFVATAVVAGFVEWFDSSLADEQRWVAPGAVAALLADLEEVKPTVLIDDGASLGDSGRKLYLYPALASYVTQHYCLTEAKAKIDFYVRRQPDGRCPVEGRD
jgi:hypothetical protein